MGWSEADVQRVLAQGACRVVQGELGDAAARGGTRRCAQERAEEWPKEARGLVVPLLSDLQRGGEGETSAGPHYRSKTERRYALMVLEVARVAGELRAWWHEGLKLRLAQTCFYTPDFLLHYADGQLGFVEVKGFWRDDARVKIKVAAALYPCFTFRAAQYVKGTWRYETF